MSLFVEVNQGQMNDVLSMLGGIERDAKTALRRSISNTAIAAKTAVAKGVGSTVTMKAKRIKEYISVRKASGNNLTAVVTLKGGLTPLSVFSTNPSYTNSVLKDYGTGISVKIWKSKRAVRLKHAFFAEMNSGHVGIFERKEIAPSVYARRLPIRELFGPSITTVYENTPGLSNRLENEAAERLLRETDAQVNFILSKR